MSKRLRNLLIRRSEGHKIRARIPNFEEQEPDIAYCSRMEKIRSEGNMIYSIKDKNGTLQNSTENIIKVSHEFYSDLFKAGVTDRQLQGDILRHTQKKITMEQQSSCDKDLNITDLEQGMKQLPLGKSPGIDGLQVEFYQTMWHLIRFDFLEMVSDVYQNKILSNSQRKGMIRLIFKKTDRTDLKYYRPISLLNVDVKIITKTLALRLGKVLPTIVSEDQSCTPGRNIAKNLHTLNDVIRYGNSKKIEAAILFLDKEKPFDRVSHEFLLRSLRHLNFGDYFVSWVQIMLKDVKSQIKINGFLTEDIDISRGVRQGDPLSALLYVLIAEVLGNQIRSNQNIRE